MSLESDVKLALAQPLDPHRVTVGRSGPLNGIKYLEGEDVIRTANRIFGYGEWGFELLSQPWVIEKSEQGNNATPYEVWAAHGRLSVSGGGSFADVGTCVRQGKGSGGLEMAIKGAVTDCVKRCLRNYGDQFGLILYDKTTDMAGLAADFRAGSEPSGDGAIDAYTHEQRLPPFPQEVPATPKPDVPEWVAKFNADRKSMGIGNSLIEEVIGTKLSVTNIEKWLNAEEGRTPDKLLSLAADRGAVGVK